MLQLKRLLSPTAKDVSLLRYHLPQPATAITAHGAPPPLSLSMRPDSGTLPPIILGNPSIQGSLPCPAGACPAPFVSPWKMVHLKAVVRGSKEAALLETLLSSPSSSHSSLCSILVRNVNVCVGYWRELHAEYTGKLESFLAKIAGRFVAEKLVDMLAEANRNARSQVDAQAGMQTSYEGDTALSYDSIVGRQGLLQVEQEVTRRFWERVQHAQLRWYSAAGEKFALHSSPLLPPYETKAQPPRPASFSHDDNATHLQQGMLNGDQATAYPAHVKEEAEEAIELS